MLFLDVGKNSHLQKGCVITLVTERFAASNDVIRTFGPLKNTCLSSGKFLFFSDLHKKNLTFLLFYFHKYFLIFLFFAMCYLYLYVCRYTNTLTHAYTYTLGDLKINCECFCLYIHAFSGFFFCFTRTKINKQGIGEICLSFEC